jgi:hypothetical protein
MGTPARRAALRTLIALGLFAAACSGGHSPAAPTPTVTPPSSPAPAPAPATPAPPRPWTLQADGVPRFITRDYIDLAPILRISRFRSAEGHSYADAVESCRSMKHYFQPRSTADWSSVRVFSPVTGVIARTTLEWAGTQLEIQSDAYPAFSVVLFHVNLAAGLGEGSRLGAGQAIGTHIGSQTTSDVAVRVDSTEGMRLVSYFDAVTDEVFDQYRLRGVASRETLIISRSDRDANPLTCDGEAFTSRGAIEGWLSLH